MKVKCIVTGEGSEDLVYGKIYDVVSIECDWYRIIDESEEDYMYPPNAFEIVDPLPAPPVLTDEDIERGDGRKYTVIDEFGELLASGEPIKYLDDEEEYRDFKIVMPKIVQDWMRAEGWSFAEEGSGGRQGREYDEVAEPSALAYG
jgi:hypothetical protein